MVTLKFGYFGSKFDSDSEVGGYQYFSTKVGWWHWSWGILALSLTVTVKFGVPVFQHWRWMVTFNAKVTWWSWLVPRCCRSCLFLFVPLWGSPGDGWVSVCAAGFLHIHSICSFPIVLGDAWKGWYFNEVFWKCLCLSPTLLFLTQILDSSLPFFLTHPCCPCLTVPSCTSVQWLT